MKKKYKLINCVGDCLYLIKKLKDFIMSKKGTTGGRVYKYPWIYSGTGKADGRVYGDARVVDAIVYGDCVEDNTKV